MASLANMLEAVDRMGLTGQDATNFIKDWQESERNERILEREEQARQREEQARQREHELQLVNAQNQTTNQPNHNNETNRNTSKIPKIPAFSDDKDLIDSYLQRFERFAEINKWEREEWAVYLSALLTGKALEVYSRLSDDDAMNYQTLKNALLKRYNLTENGYRQKFRTCKAQMDESIDEFATRMKTYLEKWIELSDSEKTYEGIRDLILKEQILDACPSSLKIHLQERETNNLEELLKVAEKYIKAHSLQLHQEKKETEFKKTRKFCENCKREGHLKSECYHLNKQPSTSRCFRCNDPNHLMKDCKVKRNITSAAIEEDTDKENQECSAGLVTPDKLILADGQELDIISCSSEKKYKKNMPVKEGRIGNTTVRVLRDSGCSGVLVSQQFVKPAQYTGTYSYMMMADASVRKLPNAKIVVNTSYFSGEVEAACQPRGVYDLFIGNIEGARNPDDPDLDWKSNSILIDSEINTVKKIDECASAQYGEEKNLQEMTNVTKETLIILQEQDTSIQNQLKNKNDTNKNIIKENDLIYRIVKDDNDNIKVKQLMVPKILRNRVLKTAHDNKMSGHLGIKKTQDRVTSHFFWPGLYGDVKRYCKSCDSCQRTIHKGRVPLAPLGKMPIIEEPFKRVGVDIIGPIKPSSTENYRYILTVMDYATRYPEAVPMKTCTAEEVADSLISVFSRIGFPQEILTDQGRQFTASYMKEVLQLLEIKHLFTTPYHPMCNGMIESFNGVLKQMLKKLCIEKPKEWHTFIDPLLFAYREVPNESTGFAPFELLYGRSVRGPIQILKEVWTNNIENMDTLTTYEHVLNLQDKLASTMEIVRENLEASREKSKKYFDKKAVQRHFKIGGKVLILVPNNTNKLQMLWKGPYTITDKVHANDYRIKINNKERTYHVNMLKEYVVREKEDDDLIIVSSFIDYEKTLDSDVTQEELLDQLETETIKNRESVTIEKNWSPEQIEETEDMLLHYHQIFGKTPGIAMVPCHRINLTTNQPCVSRPYKIPYNQQQNLTAEIKRMEKENIIRKSDSPYASPVVMVQKKDGSARICPDYRKLNKLTLFDPEPMVTTEDILVKIRSSTIFSKLDLSKGYWQVQMSEEDIPKTAFVTQDGHYEFLRMPFGLVNSGATLVKGLRKIFDQMNGIAIYMDDILIFSETWKQHMKTTNEVMRRLEEANFKLNPEKCFFNKKVIEFIGYSITDGMISATEENIVKVRKANRPTTKKEVQSFLGLTGYYRQFIPDYSTIAAPLTNLIKKGLPNSVKWLDAEENSYELLKKHITEGPILQLPDTRQPFILRTDGSNIGIGAVLLQEKDGLLFPISYSSKKLNTAESSYPAIEKECLAIYWSIKKYRNYLHGNRFILETDHDSLKYLETKKFVNNRVMRWAMSLQPYNFSVRYIRGKENCAADFLSRVMEEKTI